MNNNQEKELGALILKSLSGNASGCELEELGAMVSNDPQALNYYTEYINLYACLSSPGLFSAPSCEEEWYDMSQDSSFMLAMRELAKCEDTAVEVILEKSSDESEEKDPILKDYQRKRWGAGEWRNFAIKVACVAMVCMSLLWLDRWAFQERSVGSRPVVAQLIDEIDAIWNERMQFPYDDGQMTRDNYGLVSGYVSIRLNMGVKLLIEGPAQWSLQGENHMELIHGRVYAVVGEEAQGFSIKAGNTKVIDLGTEFGIEVDTSNNTQLHVTKGKVLLFYGSEKHKKSQVNVDQGSARQVDNTGKVRKIPLDSRYFVRGIDSNSGFIWKGQTTLSLADMLGGGNGLGNGKTEVWIDGRTGEYGDTDDPEDYMQGSNQTVVNTYVNVDISPYIDGIFTPDGGAGSVKVSSAGHIFHQCPDTGEASSKYISNASKIGWVYFTRDTLSEELWPIRLDGKLYGTKENPSIFLPPNKGITFDLMAIRKDIPLVDIQRFTAICGIAFLEGDENKGLADFWVLVDGQMRFQATDITRNSSLSKIDIKLNNNDRFLTLITTDGKDHKGDSDWAVFGKPTLRLVDKNGY